MANLTIAIDDELLRRARIRALEHGTSVNALLRTYLEAFAAPPGQPSVADALRSIAGRHPAGSGPGGRRWTREELHER